MKKIVLLLFCAIAFNLFVFSQSNFIPGYYINTNGDTTFGLINYRDDALNAKECQFKKSAESNTEFLLPGQIQSYRFIDNKFYISKKINVNNKEENIFFECLIKGKATIYYCRYDSKDRYFIEKDGKMNELKNDEIVTYGADNVKTVRYSNKYKGVLKFYFNDCPTISQDIDKVEFNKKSLINISKNYHEKVCKDEQCIIFQKKSSVATKNLGIFFSRDFLNFKRTENIYSRSNAEYFIGASYLISKPEISDYLFTKFSLGFGKLTTKNQYLPASANSDYVREHSFDLYFNSPLIKADVELLYKPLFKKIRPIISVGIPVCFILSPEEYAIPKENKIVEKYFSKGATFGFHGGLGVEFNISHLLKYQVGVNYKVITQSNSGSEIQYSASGLELYTGIVF